MMGIRSISGRASSDGASLSSVGGGGQFKYVSQNTYVPETDYARAGGVEPLDWRTQSDNKRDRLGKGRSGKIVWWMLFVIGICLVVVLFAIKARALEAKAYMRQLQHALAQEQASVQMLSAEIAHLESPARLQRLATEFLDQRGQKASQIYTLEDAMSVIPLRELVVQRGQ